MSSANFLNELKNMKFSSTSFSKPQNNYDFTNPYQTSFSNNFNYGTPLENKTFDSTTNLNKGLSVSEEPATYKVNYENYSTTLADSRNPQNDLVIVG